MHFDELCDIVSDQIVTHAHKYTDLFLTITHRMTKVVISDEQKILIFKIFSFLNWVYIKESWLNLENSYLQEDLITKGFSRNIFRTAYEIAGDRAVSSLVIQVHNDFTEFNIEYEKRLKQLVKKEVNPCNHRVSATIALEWIQQKLNLDIYDMSYIATEFYQRMPNNDEIKKISSKVIEIKQIKKEEKEIIKKDNTENKVNKKRHFIIITLSALLILSTLYFIKVSQMPLVSEAIATGSDNVTLTIKVKEVNQLRNHSVGNEWSFIGSVDGKKIGNKSLDIAMRNKAAITLQAMAIENDSYSDIGTNLLKIPINEMNFKNKKEYKIKVAVVENRGRYAGNMAQFEFVFEVKRNMSLVEVLLSQ